MRSLEQVLFPTPFIDEINHKHWKRKHDQENSCGGVLWNPMHSCDPEIEKMPGLPNRLRTKKYPADTHRVKNNDALEPSLEARIVPGPRSQPLLDTYADLTGSTGQPLQSQTPSVQHPPDNEGPVRTMPSTPDRHRCKQIPECPPLSSAIPPERNIQVVA